MKQNILLLFGGQSTEHEVQTIFLFTCFANVHFPTDKRTPPYLKCGSELFRSISLPHHKYKWNILM